MAHPNAPSGQLGIVCGH